MSAVSTYAGALFEAARERGELEEVLSDLEEFVAALHESDELRLFYYGGQIPERQKRRVLMASARISGVKPWRSEISPRGKF